VNLFFGAPEGFLIALTYGRDSEWVRNGSRRCGASLCELHADECDLCREAYCSSMCLLFHMDQSHTKPSTGVNQDDESERRRA